MEESHKQSEDNSKRQIMKIEPITVTALQITEAQSLDPIRVFLQDFAPSQGQITIECFGQAWSACFIGMGKNDIRSFFVRCDANYIAAKLAHERLTGPKTAYLIRIIETVQEALVSQP